MQKMIILQANKQILFISKEENDSVKIRYLIFPENIRLLSSVDLKQLTHSDTPTCLIDTQFEFTPIKNSDHFEITAKNTFTIYNQEVIPYLISLNCFYLSKVLNSFSKLSANNINGLIQRYNNSNPQNQCGPSFLDLNFNDLLKLAKTYSDHFDIDSALLEKASKEQNAHLIPLHEQQLQMLLNEDPLTRHP